MNAARILLLLITLGIAAFPATSYPQVPYVAVYFDSDLQTTEKDCPGFTIDMLYVAGRQFNATLSAVEYKIQYPPELTFLGDVLDTNSTAIGMSPAGIIIEFTTPIDAYGPVLFQQIHVVWNCDDCLNTWDAPVRVLPHPSSGLVRAVSWPEQDVIEAVGRTSLVCPAG